jgi:DUF917 family protein
MFIKTESERENLINSGGLTKTSFHSRHATTIVNTFILRVLESNLEFAKIVRDAKMNSKKITKRKKRVRYPKNFDPLNPGP